MRFLFVHQNFPGQFLHLARHLAALARHEVVFITEENANQISGVRKVTYAGPGGLRDGTHRDAQEFELCMDRAERVARVGMQLRGLGFMPDIIIGHHGWGELLNIEDVWPGVPVLGYYEFYYSVYGGDVGFDPEFPTAPGSFPRVRAKNAINLLALNNPGHGQTPTVFQHSTYPDWAQPRIALLPEGVDLSLCARDPAASSRPFELQGLHILPGDKLVTYVARDLEPYRGFHIFMRALPAILRARPDAKVILVGADGVSYGARLADSSWREHFWREVGGQIDAGRVLFAGRLEYDAYLRVLQRSDAHVYLTYPFVASWSLREALACGCAVIGSDTAPVHEFVSDGVTGMLTPFHDPSALADRVLALLEDAALTERLRTGARAFAERTLRLDDHIRQYDAIITRLAGQSFTPPQSAQGGQHG